MFEYFLWAVGFLSIASMIINFVCDYIMMHPNFVRISQFLTYAVAIICAIGMCMYRENTTIFSIFILGFVLSITKSLFYFITYKKMVKPKKITCEVQIIEVPPTKQENQDENKENENKNGEG